MIVGLYTAASGMVASFTRQKIVANNLANVSTTGFKQDLPVPSDFENMLVSQATGSAGPHPWDAVGEMGSGTQLADIKLDLSQGPLAETGKPLDLAISGPGFFSIQTPTGVQYTRDGTFFRDALGRLARADGGLVLGDNGPIQIGEGEILVDGDGTVKVGGQVAGRIRLVDFDPAEKLVKSGNNYLVPANAGALEQPAVGVAINQGFLERSNVDLNQATVEMLATLRSYEASQKMVQLQDQSLQLAVSEVGRV